MPLNEMINAISSRLQEKGRLFAVFDRDGTLVPIVENPDGANVQPQTTEALNFLAAQNNTHTGILSARGLNRLSLDFPDGQHVLAGNYGLEIYVPPGIDWAEKKNRVTSSHQTVAVVSATSTTFNQSEPGSGQKPPSDSSSFQSVDFVHPIADAAQGLLNQARQRLQGAMLPQYRCILEDHGLSLCLHWHLAPLTFRERICMLVEELATQTPGLQFKKLATSYEIWPNVDWDKSHGLDQMLRLSRFSMREVLFLFAGDSLPDEPAFEWVNQQGGVSVHVGNKTTEAMFSVESPAKLHTFIVELGKVMAENGRHS